VFGTNAQGIDVWGAKSSVTVHANGSVTGETQGISLTANHDSLTIHGSVNGKTGTASSLNAGNDTVTIGSSAKITGSIDGGTGTDTANFLVAKSSVDSFTYYETTNTAVVAVGSQKISFKNFEYFRFSDDTSAMTTTNAVNTFIKSSLDVSSTLVTRSGAEMSDVTVSFDAGSDILSVISGENGISTAAITGGSDLTVTGSFDYVRSEKSITSQDALDALRLSVGMDTQHGTRTAFDYISADFNQDGKVSSQDALAILKYAVGLTTVKQAEWVFVGTNGDYSSVDKSNVSYTEGVSVADLTTDTSLSLTGILIGDVNDTYSGIIA
jgi:hypothetical protein